MLVLFRHMLARLRVGVLGFSLGLFFLGWPLCTAYEVVKREQEKVAELARDFASVIGGLGGDVNNLANPPSYLSLRYFSLLPLILGVYAVLTGSGLLVADEENGTLDLVLAHPVSRTALFVGRWLALTAALVFILAVAWLGLVVFTRAYNVPVGAADLVLPFLSLLAVLLFFGNFALALSLLLPSRRLASSVSGLLLAASYFLTLFARIDPSLEKFATFSPLNYYQSGEAIEGLNVRWLVGLLTGAALWAALAWQLFERRDVRVAGEGVWRWPFRWRKAG
jgi:ABC-2 type transport system permease protein